MRGFYILLLEAGSRVEISVGSLGFHPFPKGYYAYAGSALGRGALSLERRVRRHCRRVKRVRWHIDYLTSHPGFHRVTVFLGEAETRFECHASELLRKWGGETVLRGFGSSDCRCESHLAYFSSGGEVTKAFNKLRKYFEGLGVGLKMLPLGGSQYLNGLLLE